MYHLYLNIKFLQTFTSLKTERHKSNKNQFYNRLLPDLFFRRKKASGNGHRAENLCIFVPAF